MIQEQKRQDNQEKFKDIQLKARTLTDDIGELLDLYYKLAVVTVTEKASNAAAASITSMLIILLGMFTLLFAGLGLGWYLGEKLNNIFAGYLIIACIFLMMVILTLVTRKKTLFPMIRDIIIKRIYEN